jgi:serine protease Do
MNTKQLLTTFTIAIVSAFLGVLAYSMFFGSEKEQVEVPVYVSPSARFASLPDAPQGNYPDLTYAAEKSIHAVVHVTTKGTTTVPGMSYQNPFLEFFFGPRGSFGEPQQRPVMGAGSGVILSSDGFIVTNNHVIEDASDIQVTLNDKRSFKAVKVGSDPSTDIALLKIDAADLPYLKFGSSDNLKVGEWVLAVGNPFNLTSTVTAGILSAKSRQIQILGQLSIESFLQTDAAVNPGNSGGALVNTNGELVGINTAIASRTGSFTGYSFAVPSSIVEKVVKDLMEYGEVQRGVIGITLGEMTSERAAELKMEKVRGVYINGVIPGSGAEAAGIKDGDVIITVNGEEVNSIPELQEKVSRFRPGDNIQVEVIRDGKRKPFTVKLRNIHGNTELVKTTSKLSKLGATFERVSDAEKNKLRIRNGIKVVKLTSGKFKEAGIKEGYIITQANRVPINSEEDLKKVIEVLNDGLFLTGIYPNGQVSYYAINIQE